MRRSWLRLFLAGVIVAGILTGYLVSSGLGRRLLHQEIETQLGRLLSGRVTIAEVELRFVDGLRFEARGLEAYPNADPEGQPALRASRVLAWIDFLALLIGRLELSTLVLEGPHLRVEQAADGSFPGLPLPNFVLLPDPAGTTMLGEHFVQQLESLEPAASVFREHFRAADRIEILDGTVNWIDRRNLSKDGTPRELRLELISGVAERDWLSDAISVESSAVFVDGRHAPFPIEMELERGEGSHFDWRVTFSQIPLDAAETPLAFVESIEGLTGTLDATFSLATSAAGRHTLSIEGIVENARISLRRSNSIIEQERVELHAEAVLDGRRLRVTNGRLNGQRLGIDFKGVIDRPIRPTSRARVELRMVGARIDGIRDLAGRFEEESDIALMISRLTERVDAGHVRYIEAAGTARLRHWQDLANGRTRDLPDGFLLGAAVEEIVLSVAPDAPIEGLAGEIEWVEDQLTLRNMQALYRGKGLPELNLVIDGVSHLIHSSESAREMTADPPAIPGFGPLLEILRPRDPSSLPPVKAIGLAIDQLEHPIIRWPLRDLRVLIEPLRQGMQLNIREGSWAGAAVSGDLVWRNDPNKPSVDAQLVLGPGPIPPAEEIDEEVIDDDALEEESFVSDTTRTTDRWGSGRFELEFRPRPWLPFQRAVGFFRLDGANLVGSDIEIDLEPKGQAALRFDIDLLDPESVGLDISFAITEAKLEGISEFVALPPDLATGDFGATGSLLGRVRPDASFVAELDGRVRVEAQDGRIATTLPLLLRLSKASEGYNPFANKDEVSYETMTGTLDLDQGRLTIEDFEIEGPLRVFANVQLDTNRQPGRIRAVVGIFLFRTSGEILRSLPLVRSFLPGSERGLIGAYFEVKGTVDEPSVETLPLQTLMSSVPSAIKAPFKVLQFLFGRGENGS